jgi:hypothetical protein
MPLLSNLWLNFKLRVFLNIMLFFLSRQLGGSRTFMVAINYHF